MPITTVLFDVGNTLIKPALPESVVLSQAAASLGVQIDAHALEQHIPAMYAYYEELYKKNNAIWASDEQVKALWLLMYTHICELAGISHVGEQVALLGYTRFLDPKSWTLYSDVMPTLLALRSQQITLGVISNWDNSLDSILDGLGVASFFDVVISSAVEGLHKPEPRIFKLALERMQASSHEVIYVGDHIDADYHASAAVGMIPLLIDRENRHARTKTLRRLQDLRELMEHL